MKTREQRRAAALLTSAAVGAAAGLLTLQLLVPPIVGLADNGDFERILRPAGLRHTSARYEDRYFGWMQPRFLLVARSEDPSGYRSTEIFPVRLAVLASRAFSGRAVFDIRFLGTVHLLLFLAGLAILVFACRDLPVVTQGIVAVLLVFFFTDAGYAASFNSLYSQTASLLFLLLTAALAAEAVRRGRLAGNLLLAFFLGAALFVCSKPQESVQAPLLALFGLRLAWIGGNRRRRIAALALSIVLCALAWRYYRSAERALGWVTRYNLLFMSILPISPDPAGDLIELGLDPSLARFSGTSAWDPDSPAREPTVRAFLDGRSGEPSPRVLLLRHPRRLAALLQRVARVSYALRPGDLGNYANETGAPALRQSPGAWSAIRVALCGSPWLIGFFGVTLAAAGATYRRASPRGRRFREGLAVTVAMAAVAFVTAAIGDAPVELVRHLYCFQALCDLLLVADAAWLGQVLITRMRHRAPRARPAAG